jgi:hypothetical protein
MSRRNKPTRLPFLNKADPLARKLLYAVIPGYQKGNANGSAGMDIVTKARGTIESVGNNYKVNLLGRAITPGTGLGIVRWPDNSKYDISYSFTVVTACVPRVTPVTSVGLFAKRQNLAGTGDGWSLELTSGNRFGGSTCDGVTEDQLFGDNVNLNTQYVVAYMVQRRGNRHAIYENGVRTGEAANTVVASNTSYTVSLFGTQGISVGNALDAEINVALLYRIAMPRSGISMLNTDPYRMFKPLHKDFMFGPGASPSAGVGNSAFFIVLS